MNNIALSGIIKNIDYSHTIEDVIYNKALLLVTIEDGYEDVINLKFKSLSCPYKNNEHVELIGNIRSYSYKVKEDKNRVLVYVFTYFDKPEAIEANNIAYIEGRICKINDLRTTKNGKHNIHFILANNLYSTDNKKRLNSYIPCIAWGKTAEELSKLSVNTQLRIKGQLHSREHKKLLDNGELEIRVAHELLVNNYEVI